jgi:hypothetical protein
MELMETEEMKWFFNNPKREVVLQELDEINVNDHQLTLGPLIPEEEELGELKEREKKILIMISLLEAKISELSSGKRYLRNPLRVKHNEAKAEDLKERIKFCLNYITYLLFKRFDRWPLSVKGDCKVVVSNKSQEQMRAERYGKKEEKTTFHTGPFNTGGNFVQ